MTRARRPLLVAAAVVGLAGCGGEGSRVGIISSTTPSLCIAEPAAAGVCVPGAGAAGHQVGNCVSYVYRKGSSPEITAIETVDAADHADECPAGALP